MYFCRIIQNHIIMNPGKNRCEYLKEIRKRIATENVEGDSEKNRHGKRHPAGATRVYVQRRVFRYVSLLRGGVMLSRKGAP